MAVYTLGQLVEEVDKIDKAIYEIDRSIRHAQPFTVRTLLQSKTQLERLREFIMDKIVTSNVSLTNLIIGNRVCLNDCMGQTYSDKTTSMGKTRAY